VRVGDAAVAVLEHLDADEQRISHVSWQAVRSRRRDADPAQELPQGLDVPGGNDVPVRYSGVERLRVAQQGDRP
jgi:hypothetical protein